MYYSDHRGGFLSSVPPVTKNIIIINILVMIMTWLSPEFMYENFSLFYPTSAFFKPWQIITHMFMHGGFWHIFFNMYTLFIFGCVLERMWGPKKFLLFYFVTGIGAALMHTGVQAIEMQVYMSQAAEGSAGAIQAIHALKMTPTVGASGAVYGILLAFGMIFPEQRIFIFPFPFPIKAKWFVIIYAGLEVAQALSTPGDGVAHLAHLGGMAFGYMMIRYWRSHLGTGYGMDGGTQFFDSMRASWERQRNRWTANRRSDTGRHSAGSDPDWEYNARKKAEQEEIDRILDKIRRNGYDSLTKEEKQTLFDSSNRK